MPAQKLVFACECALFDKEALEYGLVSRAGLISDIASGVLNFVKNNFDTEHPIRSIINEFVIPGALWTVSPLLGGAYEIAVVAGWDAPAFWSKVEDGLESYVAGLKKTTTAANKALFRKTSQEYGTNKPSDQEIDQKVQSIIDDALNSTLKDTTSDTPTSKQTEVLQNIAPKMNTSASRHNAKLIVEAIVEYQSNRKKFIKNAGWLSVILRPLKSFLAKTIGWVFKRALYGLGLTAGAGLASTLLDTNQDKTQSGGQAAKDQQSTIANLMPISKSSPQELYDYHDNSISSVWIENGDIADVPASLMSWIMAAYPQLKKYQDDIEGSSAFRTSVSQIVQRNRLAKGYGFYVIPPPSERKIDIVGNIVSNFVNDHVKSLS